MSVRSVRFQDGMSAAVLVRAGHLLDAIAHGDKNIGDLYVVRP